MQAIRTRYFGPTDHLGSRIQAKCEARAVYVPYDHALDIDGNHAAACAALVRRMGWHAPHGQYAPMVGGYFSGDRYWVFADDERVDVAAEAQAVRS